jgi:NADPH2:quinone reductase
MKSVVMMQAGSPEVLAFVDRPEPTPGPGQALVEVAAAGVNFMDTGARRGLAWGTESNPKTLGVEGAGRVLAVGDGVTRLRSGDRVAWCYVPGSYTERLVAQVDALVPIPDGVDDQTAAAVMMQGLTASHFATNFYPVNPGDIALVHAASGGLGLLLTQVIKMRGGQIIGRVSSSAKIGPAKEAGADHVVVDTEGKFADEVIRLSGGSGVNVVYDGSGPITYAGSIASLRTSGTLCWYGPVLGGPGPIDIMGLPKSIKIGYGVFSDHVPTPEALRGRAAQLFDWIIAGDLKVRIGKTYPLSEAARSHADMDSRASTGKLLLIP